LISLNTNLLYKMEVTHSNSRVWQKSKWEKVLRIEPLLKTSFTPARMAGWAQWLTPVILGIWRLRSGDSRFKASLGI
jgi:hypothetical protein